MQGAPKQGTGQRRARSLKAPLLRTVTGEGGAAVSEKVPGDWRRPCPTEVRRCPVERTFQRVSSRQKQISLRAGLKG